MEKDFDKEELKIKVLKCLNRSLQPNVMTISKPKDLSTMTTASLFEKLWKNEIEMNGLNEQESSEKKIKNIALNSSTKKIYKSDEDVAEFSENENLNLLVKKFGK